MSELNEKKAAFTRDLLLDAASELSQTLNVSELSFKKVSEHAGISERTMFRYFTSRDEFLDALTARLYNELNLPDMTPDPAELPSYVAALYREFDAQPRRVLVLLDSELFPRILDTTAKARFEDLKEILAREFPAARRSNILKTAANLRYVMSASSWRYYRINFEFDLQTSTECAQMLVHQALSHLRQSSIKKRSGQPGD